ncbi:pentraxin-related protein PTX3-like [Echeneis naucrates]|uniref:pentraxin-related protein PTX3-like n=1 Tax=Echeneis naucrates TaxID=173247 RepID=UPI001113C1E3|nr:pentraxin-related protein PTX3-like [Echeneis naucrates]
MRVSRTQHVLCVLGFAVASLCVNEYEGNYADNYDNEISEDQQEGESKTASCQTADFSRWDKLFIALEDSHMRQNVLLRSLEQCCGGMVSLRAQVEKLARGGCQQQCAPNVGSACRAQAEQASLRLQRSLVELREEEAVRERRLNATLHMLLHSSHEENVRLKRLEDGGGHRAGNRMRHQPTPRPGAVGAAVTLGMKPFLSGLKEQEVTSSPDTATMERALVSMATELQHVHLQLSRLMEQAGTFRKDRGDT